MICFIGDAICKFVRSMHLKKLEITGFKSFSNKTTLDFLASNGKTNPVTVVVGPNGSGKSNISDAMRWVIGEQSLKSLRGKKAEDIIFAGSNKKARLSTASVTITFDNTDKKIPLEYDEVVISRKIHRSGEGEYLINGSRVRLMDVVDNLAAAGVGKESHCIVNQGMTDATLAASPLDRRTMIESAAGVRQFQIKKERAFRKLDRTHENLLRTAELIAEIEPHLKMLKRQAKKAQQGKEVFEKLKAKQRTYFAYLWHVYQAERTEALALKNEIGIEMKNEQREVDKLNDAILAESKKVENANVVSGYEVEKREKYTALSEFDRAIAVASGTIEITQERITQEKAVKSIPVDLAYVRDRVTMIREAQDTMIEQLNAVDDLDQLDVLRERAQEIGADIAALYDDAGKKEVKISGGHNTELITQYEQTITNLEKEVVQKKEKHAVVKEEIAQIDEKISHALRQDHQARQKFFELEKQLRSQQEKLTAIRDRFNDAKIRLAKVEVREDDMERETKEELHVSVASLEYDGEEIDRDVVAAEIGRLKNKYAQIGGIDPMVVDEYQETQERFDFLLGESKDLEKAIVSLKEVIKEMEKVIDREFAKAYAHINKEFTKYFRVIFGGGTAHLTKIKVPVKTKEMALEEDTNNLIEGGDPSDEDSAEDEKPQKTEIGIEISAHPPGKKVRQLSLLSGGERSLTSIALLFAIISYNPPPFAVLDEVEAALDEANSRRFGKILQELSKDTQFVIITHNRETMRQADTLYGVTMNDDGVSRLLSVRLDQIGLEKDIADVAGE